MKIIELNQDQFSLKNIMIQFECESSKEVAELMKKLHRNGNKVQLTEHSILVTFDIFELSLFVESLQASSDKQELQNILHRHQLIWSGNNFSFDLTKKSIVYSILNITPDSFYDGAPENLSLSHILKRAESDIEHGAAVLELGGKSSRPGYSDITPEEEWLRLETPLKEIRKNFPQSVLAVDTDEAYVMERVLDIGVDIVNDIDGFDTVDKLKIVENYHPSVVAMNNGRAGFSYADNVYEELSQFFLKKSGELSQLGLKREQICIDPGVGFFTGPSGSDSVQRINTTEILTRLGLPVMIAISRKSFMGNIFGVDADERLFSTLMFEAKMMLEGGRILRVHDVAETKRLIDAVELYKTF